MFERKKGNGIYRQRSDRDADGNVKSTHCGTAVSGRVAHTSAYEMATGGSIWETDAIITELYEKEGLGTVRIAERLLSEFDIGKPMAQDTTGLDKEMWAEEPLGKNVIEKRLKILGVWKGDRRKKKNKGDNEVRVAEENKIRIFELGRQLERAEFRADAAEKQLAKCRMELKKVRNDRNESDRKLRLIEEGLSAA